MQYWRYAAYQYKQQQKQNYIGLLKPQFFVCYFSGYRN